ncbi:hypothetical protein C8039_10270 [Halogeometricum sp. wsp3]|nr:hypothetical protein C8039_10270 [Halogeometricum sp. wsp3]
MLGRFREAGWDIVTMAAPTGRYAESGPSRAGTCDAHPRRRRRPGAGPSCYPRRVAGRRVGVVRCRPARLGPMHGTSRSFDSGIHISTIEDHYDIAPSKSDFPVAGPAPTASVCRRSPSGSTDSRESFRPRWTHATGLRALAVSRRWLSLVRQVIQYIDEHAPDGRGKVDAVSRLLFEGLRNGADILWRSLTSA